LSQCGQQALEPVFHDPGLAGTAAWGLNLGLGGPVATLAAELAVVHHTEPARLAAAAAAVVLVLDQQGQVAIDFVTGGGVDSEERKFVGYTEAEPAVPAGGLAAGADFAGFGQILVAAHDLEGTDSALVAQTAVVVGPEVETDSELAVQIADDSAEAALVAARIGPVVALAEPPDIPGRRNLGPPTASCT
jgi:hypothetical protein